MVNVTQRKWMTAAAVLLVVLVAACTDSAANGAPAVGAANAPANDRGGASGRGGRSAASIVLAATDVATAARATIQNTTPISGDLRPIEEIVVRARIEGDLTAVLVREGDPVAANAVLARFDTADLDAAFVAAQADVASARGDSSTSLWNLDQSRELFRAGAISEQALRAAEQTALAANARLAAAASRLHSAEIGKRDAVVRAPATGTISQRAVQKGERVARGAQLFTLVRDDTLELTAALPARAAMLVRAGQEVRFTVDAQPFVGRVARVSPAIDPASRSVAVFVRVPNRDHRLKANAFASGRVTSSEKHGVLAVPLTAIRRSRQDDAPFVYRIEGGQIGIAPVKLGDSDEAAGMVEVLDGLSENDRVVVGNVGTIGRGMRVQVLDNDRRPGRGSRP